MSNPESPATTSPNYSMGAKWYSKNISTPSEHPKYFRRNIAPLIDKARQKGSDPVRIIDIACGHANELKHLIDFPDHEQLQITGLDISEDSIQTARETFAADFPSINANFVVGDAEQPPAEIEPESYDVAILVNAMAYKPGHILESAFNALKPGGTCTVNFMIPGKNPPYIEHVRDRRKCTLKNKELEITCNGKSEVFNQFAVDYTQIADEQARKLQVQAFFQSEEDIERLIRLIGFEIIRHEPFNFASIANPNNDFDIYILRKPEKPGEVESTQAEVREQVLSLTDL